MKPPKIVQWLIFGLIFAGACYCIGQCADSFKNEYTEPETVQQ